MSFNFIQKKTLFALLTVISLPLCSYAEPNKCHATIMNISDNAWVLKFVPKHNHLHEDLGNIYYTNIADPATQCPTSTIHDGLPKNGSCIIYSKESITIDYTDVEEAAGTLYITDHNGVEEAFKYNSDDNIICPEISDSPENIYSTSPEQGIVKFNFPELGSFEISKDSW